MKFKTILLILSAAIMLAALNCRKDDLSHLRVLPPVTQEGKNTFGCKVDGEVWVPYYKCRYMGNPCGQIAVDVFPLTMQNNLPVQIYIGIGKKYSDGSQSFFDINTLVNNGIFTTGEKIDSINVKYFKPGIMEYFEADGMGSANHFIITKLDIPNRIISGTFEAILYRSLTDSVKITEGRFDFKFDVCKCSD